MNEESKQEYKKQTADKCDTLELKSSSRHTANADPIILRNTERIQIKFAPILVDNESDPEKCVSGKLIYEKKQEKDPSFPTEKVTPQKIRTGEYMEITLHTSETLKLFEGLDTLYKLYQHIGKTPSGSATYTKVDSQLAKTLSILLSDQNFADVLAKSENIEIFRQLLNAITQAGSTESLASSLLELDQANVSLLTNSINIARMKKIVDLLESNLENDNEEFWQGVFKDNQWILSQVFSTPCTIFEEKAYVGGKNISNENGNICDFIYKNKLTNNISIIEIKTPCTKVLGGKYRGTYSLSAELSGSINQVLKYKDSLIKEYYQNAHKSGDSYQAFNPQCVIILGTVGDFGDIEIAALENYRNSLSNIAIITFDELLQRIKDILAVFSIRSALKNGVDTVIVSFEGQKR